MCGEQPYWEALQPQWEPFIAVVLIAIRGDHALRLQGGTARADDCRILAIGLSLYAHISVFESRSVPVCAFIFFWSLAAICPTLRK